MNNVVELRDLLVCPACRGDLEGIADVRDGDVRCAACHEAYPVRDGIVLLLPSSFDAASVHDETDHGHAHKRSQAAHYDAAAAAEFEITRPHGAPAAYRAMLREKFARSIARLPDLRGMTVLDACSGSGMDAEMLVRAGARVIALDVSEGCARRAQERARRYGVEYLTVVGDVEHLPLRDAAVDVSYVHDGLHHLEDADTGLRELARVARRAVSVTEPADALGTAVAVRLGLALAREEAGNRVARLRADDAVAAFDRLGFEATAQRYLMHYPHQPGTGMRLASSPALGPMYRAGRATANALIGRWGNKLQVTALRRAA